MLISITDHLIAMSVSRTIWQIYNSYQRYLFALCTKYLVHYNEPTTITTTT